MKNQQVSHKEAKGELVERLRALNYDILDQDQLETAGFFLFFSFTSLFCIYFSVSVWFGLII